MLILIPTGHESNKVRRMPWITFSIIAVCFIIHVFVFLEMSKLEDQFEDTILQLAKYYHEHPYLELDPEMEEILFLDEKYERAIEEARDRLGGYVPAEYLSTGEQEKLDQLSQEIKDIRNRVPFRKWGFIPAAKSFLTLLTHMFFHAGWLHLIGNLLFLYLTGPFIEDVWGRPVYVAFYLTAGIFSGLLYAVRYPDLAGPLIGASGAIAGVMGAFLIRYWKTRIHFSFIFFFVLRAAFRAPAWLMLPLWLLLEILNARAMDTMAEYGGSGVAHWAHVWGFVFGAAAAMGMKFLKVEKKYINPKIEAQTTYVNESYKTFEEASRLMIDDEKKDQAYAMLLEAAQKDPTYQEVVETLWNLCLEIGKEHEAAPFLVNLLENEMRNRRFDLALPHYRHLKENIPGDSIISSHSKIKLMAYMIDQEEYEEAEELYNELIKEVSVESPPGLLLDFCDVVLRFDLKCDRSLAREVIELSLRHPGIPEDKRNELKAKSYKRIPEKEEEIDIDSRLASVTSAALAELENQGKTRIEKELKVSKAVPLALEGKKLFIKVEGKGPRTFSLDHVRFISVVRISSQSDLPLFLIDLLLDDPLGNKSMIRIIRLFSTEFDVQKFVPGAQNAAEAFSIFATLLLKLSGAQPYPDLESVKLKKGKVFPTIEAYENSFI